MRTLLLALIALMALFLLASCSPVRLAARRAEASITRHGFRSVLLEQGDLRVRYWIGGRGPAVLLLHGFGGDGLWTWRGQMPALAAQHTVLVPDLLWFGASEAAGPPTLERQVDAALAVLDAAGAGSAAVVGISYGGFVTLALTNRAPERVSRMVIVDSPGPFFSPDDQREMLDRLGFPEVEDLFVPQSPEAVRALIGLAWAKPPPLPGPVVRDLQATVFSQHQEEQRALLADLLARREDPASQALPVGKPALLLWGALDPVFPLALGQRLADALGAGLIAIPGAAHAPNLEKVSAFNSAIVGFLSTSAQETGGGHLLGSGEHLR